MVKKYLDLSISHISEYTCSFLEQHLGEIVSSYAVSYKYGFYIPILSKEEYEEEKILMPPDFYRLIKYAQNKNCSLICLDRDADTVNELEIYNW